MLVSCYWWLALRKDSRQYEDWMPPRRTVDFAMIVP